MLSRRTKRLRCSIEVQDSNGSGSVIMFIDEMHMGAGATSSVDKHMTDHERSERQWQLSFARSAHDLSHV